LGNTADETRKLQQGIFTAAMSLYSSLVTLGYWWCAYRQRGLKARPRVSFREVYVLYFGMSVEVGLIVYSITAEPDAARNVSALLLPAVLIAVIALMDDTPDSREVAEQKLVRMKAARISVLPKGPGNPSSGLRRKRREAVVARTRQNVPPPQRLERRGWLIMNSPGNRPAAYKVATQFVLRARESTLETARRISSRLRNTATLMLTVKRRRRCASTGA
jgi:hypothetical protein